MNQPLTSSRGATFRPSQVWLWCALLLVAALLPRCWGLADYFTIDEGYHWIQRVRLFSEALADQKWSATYLTGHPGVTTTWLGSLGRALAAAWGVPDDRAAGATTAYLAMLRLPLAVLNGLVVVPGYLLLRRLLAEPVALLAAFLWALAPFIVGFDRLLHVDGLTTSFASLSILLLLVALLPGAARTGRGRWLALIGSGCCAGLAVLSKSSGLVLLPWAGLAMAAFVLAERRGWLAWVRDVAAMYLAWLAAAALTFWACWPAMWVAPWASFMGVIDEAINNGGQPHASGNFFLGVPVPDPGGLFYIAVVLWRSDPITLLGLLGFAGVLVWRLLAWRRRAPAPAWWLRDRWVLGALCGAILLFGLALSIAAKKFDRYSLPAWPALEVLAAYGLVAIWRWLAGLLGPRVAALRGRAAAWAAGALAVLSVALGDLSHQPYYMSYYNPALGGGAVAQHVLLIGWGEGMEHIGAWLQQRPDFERGAVLSWIPPTLAPFLPRGFPLYDIRTTTIHQPDPMPNYAVLYERAAMREETPEPEAYVRQTPPLYTLEMFGIPYATIHQLPRPYETPLAATFDGGALALRGYTLKRDGATLSVWPSWDVRRDQPGGVMLFLHVLNERGERVGQIDAAVDEGMFPTWQRGQQFGITLPIGLPADLPAGEYRVVMGLYRESGRLAVDAGALPEAVDGPNAIQLATFTVGQ
ncbi:glycosyl transferase [Chloroflexia bacterium SDU3-3]|nr:glycosyl transferase [Chloroflexia bacterium SDU3-3]